MGLLMSAMSKRVIMQYARTLYFQDNMYETSLVWATNERF
jgi:hypothetical protein